MLKTTGFGSRRTRDRGVDRFALPLSRLYLTKTVILRQLYPPVTGRMEPKNMSNYRAPKVNSKLGPDPIIGNLMAVIRVGNSGDHRICLQVVPVRTDFLPAADATAGRHAPLHNYHISLCVCAASSQPCDIFFLPFMASTVATL